MVAKKMTDAKKPRELLIKGHTVIIDEIMFPIVSKFTWHIKKDKKTFYAVTNIKISNKNHLLPMHRLLSGIKESQIDHVNRNGLDNRQINLRYATAKQNSYNRKRENKLGYRGVYKPSKSSNFAFQIQADGKRKSGYGYKTAKDAAIAYDKANKELHGEFGIRNFKE